MSLNNIDLNNVLLSELYKGQLIAGSTLPPLKQPEKPPTSVAAPITPPAGTGYKVLGSNKRNISIIVDSPGVAFLPDDQLAFLSKMLEACKMNIAHVAILNQATAPIDIAELKTQLKPAFVLLFGVGPVDIKLPLNFPAFRVQQYDECTYLASPALAELLVPGDEGKKLKVALWTGLKTMFNI